HGSGAGGGVQYPAPPALGCLASRRPGRVALWAAIASAYIEDLARRRRAGGASGSAGSSSGSATAWAALRERRVWATPLAVAVSLSEHAECNMSPTSRPRPLAPRFRWPSLPTMTSEWAMGWVR